MLTYSEELTFTSSIKRHFKLTNTKSDSRIYLDADKKSALGMLKKLAKDTYLDELHESIPNEFEIREIADLMAEKADSYGHLSYFSLKSINEEMIRQNTKLKLFLSKYINSEMFLVMKDKKVENFQKFIEFVVKYTEIYIIIHRNDCTCSGKVNRSDLNKIIAQVIPKLNLWRPLAEHRGLADFPIFMTCWMDYRCAGKLDHSFILDSFIMLDNPENEKLFSQSWVNIDNYTKIWRQYNKVVNNSIIDVAKLKIEMPNINPEFLDFYGKYLEKNDKKFNIDTYCEIFAALGNLNQPKSIELVASVLCDPDFERLDSVRLTGLLAGFNCSTQIEDIANGMIHNADKASQGYITVADIFRLKDPEKWISCVIKKDVFYRTGLSFLKIK